MSGIAGIARRSPSGVVAHSLGRMAGAIRHRGPDAYGFFTSQRVGLAHVLLSTIDGAAGAQPVTNEDGRIVVAADCEIVNHPELRNRLERRGHVFASGSHAEVLAHGYEEWGSALLSRLDGQFAFAVYDRNSESVFLARDRFGIRPLYYAQRDGDFYFGSEVKAILASGEVEAGLDQRGLDEVLRLGAARPPRTMFSGIASLEPGTYGIWQNGAFWLRHYYELDYPENPLEQSDAIEVLDEIMLRSVGLRLRSRAAVGAYLCGGLESSIVASLARRAAPHALNSVSMTYAIPEFDESLHQSELAMAIGTKHTAGVVEMNTIAQSLPRVIWHAESPLVETEPALMYHVAKLARESGITVVMSGVGADELFLGSDVFRESSVRRFCLRQPHSSARRRLFGRVLSGSDRFAPTRETIDFLLASSVPSDPLFSHVPRFLSSGISDFYTREFKADLAGNDVIGELRASLPTRFFAWSPLNQAAYLETITQLSPYVLSSRGDRMASAHGLSARYPFLDHRLFEFAAALPTGSKLRGLHGKQLVQRWASRILPAPALAGAKLPRPAPASQYFLLPNAPSWVGDQLTPEAIRRVGIFSSSAVNGLVRRCAAGAPLTSTEDRAMVGILSTQLWYNQFIESALQVAPLPTSHAAVTIGGASLRSTMSATAGNPERGDRFFSA